MSFPQIERERGKIKRERESHLNHGIRFFEGIVERRTWCNMIVRERRTGWPTEGEFLPLAFVKIRWGSKNEKTRTRTNKKNKVGLEKSRRELRLSPSPRCFRKYKLYKLLFFCVAIVSKIVFEKFFSKTPKNCWHCQTAPRKQSRNHRFTPMNRSLNPSSSYWSLFLFLLLEILSLVDVRSTVNNRLLLCVCVCMCGTK